MGCRFLSRQNGNIAPFHNAEKAPSEKKVLLSEHAFNTNAEQNALKEV